MIRRLVFLLLALLPLGATVHASCSNTALGSGFVCVSSHAGSGGTVSQTVVFASGHTATNTVVVWAEANSVLAFSGTASVNISNTLGYTWLIARGNCVQSGQQTIVYYAVVPTTSGTSDTITVLNASGTFMIVHGAELSNTGALHGAGGCGGTTATATVAVGNLAIGNAVGSSGLAAGSGWTMQESTAFSVFETQIAAGTSVTATFTGTAAVSTVIAFDPPASTNHAFQVGGFLTGP